jgi:hypothetical protein
MSINTESQSVVPIAGAFEMFAENEGDVPIRENLTTLTRGHLLEIGDVVAPLSGVEAGKPYILHAVNELGTPTCDACVSALDQVHAENPELPIFTITKQDLGKFYDEHPEARSSSQTAVSVSHEQAIDLGVALEPGEDADPTFWSSALRRTLAVVDGAGRVADVQQPLDQEEMLDFDRAASVVSSLS